ncbi:hypothetical protein [Parvularcula sp. LCG005]|uniref:hypothetical protein n=1 Tax=Parvularcula sp. LCG005 TaxID=3078805 RepID=UPI0029424B1C|nr:hypothetical protein [Parvularcula sp. LCG005]WOI52461.1 hypothetical protein RUI03_09910 [Parvularcula sp. LCG005]
MTMAGLMMAIALMAQPPATVSEPADVVEDAGVDGGTVVSLAAPTILPRSLPARDERGQDFADRVSLSPDGSTVAFATKTRTGFTLSIATIGEQTASIVQAFRGEPTFVGWRDDSSVLVGRRDGKPIGTSTIRPLMIDVINARTGQATELPNGGSGTSARAWHLANGIYAQDVMSGGFVHDAAGGRTLAIYEGGSTPRVTDCCSGDAMAVQAAGVDGARLLVEQRLPGGSVTATCPGSSAAAALPEGVIVQPAGPADRYGRPVVLVDADEAPGFERLAVFDCDTATFDETLYEDDRPIGGALFNARNQSYYGVWRESGDRIEVFDRSLAHDLREVEAAQAGPATAYPIDFVRGNNTVLVYVAGPQVAGGYYLYDRYMGFLDLVIQFAEEN